MKNQKGFTLIELLVVIAIIGLLSTLAVISLNNARQKSRDSKRLADVKQIQTALEMYYNDNNGYPDALDDGNMTKYMATIPQYPTPIDGANCSTVTTYNYNGDTTTYQINYCLGADTGGVPGDAVHTATPAGIQ